MAVSRLITPTLFHPAVVEILSGQRTTPAQNTNTAQAVVPAVVERSGFNKKRPALLLAFFIYRPLRNEIMVPNNPTTAMPIIISPIGTRPELVKTDSCVNVGIDNGGGAV